MHRTSLVILTRNRRAAVLDCVSSALALPEKPPLIVVDNGSTDGTAPALKGRHPKVRLIRVPFDMGAAARNLGIDRAETPYVAFCDDDAAFVPGALDLAANILDMYPRVALLAPRVFASNGEVEAECRRLADGAVPAPALPGPSLGSFDGGACVCRRSAFHDGFEGWQLVYLDSVTVRRLLH